MAQYQYEVQTSTNTYYFHSNEKFDNNTEVDVNGETGYITTSEIVDDNEPVEGDYAKDENGI